MTSGKPHTRAEPKRAKPKARGKSRTAERPKRVVKRRTGSSTAELAARDRDIVVRAATGWGHARLADEYSITERQVREIVSRGREERWDIRGANLAFPHAKGKCIDARAPLGGLAARICARTKAALVSVERGITGAKTTERRAVLSAP